MNIEEDYRQNMLYQSNRKWMEFIVFIKHSEENISAVEDGILWMQTQPTIFPVDF